jgi:hypothetical protein
MTGLGDLLILLSTIALAVVVLALVKRIVILEARADINDRRDYRQDDKIDKIK